MKRLPFILTLITVSVATIMTSVNVLDTFVFSHKAGTIDVEENYDFDLPDRADLSEKTTATYTKGTRMIGDVPVEYHLVEIKLKQVSDLRTLVSSDSSGKYGSNITSSFSSLVKKAGSKSGNVLVAISGDYPFWQGRKGYVVRNGVGLRSKRRSTVDGDLAVFKDGSVLLYDEDDYSYDDIMEMHGGCYQNWCFGPALILSGKINVGVDDEIDGQSKSNNQRTAVGIVDGRHYFFLSTSVNGSRNDRELNSFSLYELAKFFEELGCANAYNLDGGGSVAMYVGGEYVVNTTRKLGDIIYVVDA